MRLRRIDAVRFGALPPECSLGDLGENLTVVFGPNEAGKTSFTALVRQVLFGFPDGRSSERRYTPVSGEQPAGRLVFGEGGSECVVERVGGKRGGTVETRGPDSEGLLDRLTAGVTPDVYRGIFGFGLDELSDVSGLENIQNRLYATAAGLEKNPHEVRQQLKDRAEALWSQQGRTKHIHNLNKELADVRGRIREAERRAEDFRSEQAELDRLTEEAAGLQEAARAGRLRAKKLDVQAERARNLDQQVRGADGVREKLMRELADAEAQAEKLDIDEAVLEKAGAIDELVAHAEWYAQAVKRADVARERARDAKRALADALASIGDGWDAARLDMVPLGPAVDSGIDLGEQQLREAKALLDEPGRTATDLREELRVQAGEVSRLAEEIGLDGVGDRQAEVRLKALAALHPRSGGLRTRIPVVVAIVIALAVMVGGAVMGNWPVVVSGLLPLGLAAYLLFAPAAADDAPSPEMLRAAGLSSRPEAEELFALQSQLQAYLAVAKAAAATEGKLAVLDGKSAEARRAYEAQLAKWDGWLDANGLGAAGEPLAARALLREVRAAQEARQRLAQSEAEATEARDALRDYARKAEKLGLARETDEPMVIATAVRTAKEALDASRTAGRRAEELKATGDRITDELGRLGAQTDKAAADLAAALKEAGVAEDGGLPELEGLAEVAAQEADEADEAARTAATRRAELAGRLEAVANETEGAQLRLTEAGLIEQLRHALEEYAVTAMAVKLVDETLALYERERQPAIVKRAGAIFSTMTGGRYPNVVTPLGSFALTVEDADRRSKPGSALSRGTAEQLYLALRLAYIENLRDVHPALPVLMDDVLVNFDDEGRQAAAAAAIAEFAERRQVIFFTCHERVADLFAEAAPQHTRLKLERC